MIEQHRCCLKLILFHSAARERCRRGSSFVTFSARPSMVGSRGTLQPAQAANAHKPMPGYLSGTFPLFGRPAMIWGPVLGDLEALALFKLLPPRQAVDVA